jgi:photosystem II stability/assembly factor-like uncharacterized protein
MLLSAIAMPMLAEAHAMHATATFDCGAVTQIPSLECQALVALYNRTGGTQWTNHTGWLANSTPCSWIGVFCGAGHVTWLSLGNNQLTGSIPPKLGNMSALRTLDLSSNRLSGPMALSMGRLKLNEFDFDATVCAPPDAAFDAWLNGLSIHSFVVLCNDGAHWSSAYAGLEHAGIIAAIAGDPQAAGTLYAADQLGNIYKTMDGGAPASAASSPQTGKCPNVLAIDPRTPSTLYLASGAWNSVGLFKTTDGGAHWKATTNPTCGQGPCVVNSLAFGRAAPGTLYAGTGTGVFKSKDGTAHWSATGLVTPTINTLLVDPSAPATLYAAGSGLYKSKDGGAHWITISSLWVDFLIMDPKTPTTFYALTGGIVSKSTDGGAHWSATGPGLVSRRSAVSSLAIDPRAPRTLYAGTRTARFSADSGRGVFRSTDGGASWQEFSYGLRSLDVTALAFSHGTPARLFAGTFAGIDRNGPVTLPHDQPTNARP